MRSHHRPIEIKKFLADVTFGFKHARRIGTAPGLGDNAGLGLGARPQDKTLVSKGHRLATAICSACRVATPDQPNKPILKPPAPSFESIVQRKDVTLDSLRNFLKTTHRGLDRPKGMPDPSLMDYQITEVIAYILSLRK